MKKLAYQSLIRSGLEYGATIWDPYVDTQKKSLESVQNRAIRWIHGLGPREQCSITKLREELGWKTLEERRLQQRLTLLYKILNGEVIITPEDLGLEETQDYVPLTDTSSERRGHEPTASRTQPSTAPYQPGTGSPPMWRRLALSTSSIASCPRCAHEHAAGTLA